MLAVMGLEDIVVVQTADATLVADKKKANLAKKVFERLRDRDNSKHASHQQVYMSWGYTTLMQEAENRQSKTVTVNPECTTDEQKYNKRITHWIITKGEGLVSVDGKNTNIKAGESVCLTAGTVYTIKNTTTSSLEIIEISLGDMNEETVIQKEGIEEQMNASVLSASMEKIVPLNN
jgi:mannose-6-phosphate isomerase-like protein (cupin superfamily)